MKIDKFIKLFFKALGIMFFVGFIGTCSTALYLDDVSEKRAIKNTYYIKAYDKTFNGKSYVIFYKRYDKNFKLIDSFGVQGECVDYITQYRYDKINIGRKYFKKNFKK